MQSGGGTSGSPGTGQVFMPPGQPEVAGALGSTIQPLIDLSANAGAGTPAAGAYPVVQDFVSQYLTGQGPAGGAFGNIHDAAFTGANLAADYGVNTLFPRGAAQGDTLSALGQGAVGPAGTALSQGFDPAYGRAVSGIQGNPFYQQALDAAQGGAALGAQGANYVQNQAGAVGNTVNPLIQSGFDPRSALFNRSRDQLLDQTNAIQSMSGVAGSPYGASVTSNALGKFDTDWQNQQLARQESAAGAAGQAADRSGLLYSMAPGIVTQSGAAPGNVYTGQIGQELSALGARNQGAASGLANYATGLADVSGGLQGGQNIGAQGAQLASTLGAAPYNLGTGMASNAISGLNSQTNLGNQQFLLPQQVISDLETYLGRGQTASSIAGQLQNQAFNQNTAGIGGGLSAANQLFGGGGGGGLLGGGGGGGLLGSLGGLGAAAQTGFDFGGGGELGLAAAGGLGAPGFDAASLAPLALSA